MPPEPVPADPGWDEDLAWLDRDPERESWLDRAREHDEPPLEEEYEDHEPLTAEDREHCRDPRAATGPGSVPGQKREHHPHAKIGAIGRPDIRRQLAQHAEISRPCLKHGVASRLRQPVLHEIALWGGLSAGLMGRIVHLAKRGSEHAAQP